MARYLISMLILAVVFFYFEILFRIVTGVHIGYGLIPILLFSLIYGQIGYLLTSIARSRKINHRIKTVLIAVTTLPFLVEYFIFRQFKVYYSINTITNAAGDVATSNFLLDIFKLIFSLQGLLTIILYVCIPVLYGLYGRKVDACARASSARRIMAAGIMVAAMLLNMILIVIPRSYREDYNSKYTFQSAIPHFGLLTATRLEVKSMITGGNDKVAFENVEVEKKKKTHYGRNELKIDYAELASKTDDKTLKNMDEYVASQQASSKNEYTGMFKGKNLIFISAEAFSAEVIDKERTPTLYRMAHKGIQFKDYYQPAAAGTTGGEVQNIFGMHPLKGGATFKEMAKHHNYYTLGWQLNQKGYYGKVYHNNDYTYYGRDVTHVTLGYSDGYMGMGNGMEKYVDDKNWPESDLEMIDGTVPEYINKEKFNIYYMSVSGHSVYSWKENDMSRKNQDSVAELEEKDKYSEPVLAYLACNVELDKAMKSLIKQLEEAGKADDTVIVISADHFPYGLDADSSFGNQPYLSELYGFEPKNQIERDHNRLIMWCGSLEKEDPIKVDDPVSGLDIAPTLMNLFGIKFDSRLFVGRDVFSDATPLIFDSGYDWKTDKGTYISKDHEFKPASKKTKVSDDYVDTINKIVGNKMIFNKGLIQKDYYYHVFGDQKLKKVNSKDVKSEGKDKKDED